MAHGNPDSDGVPRARAITYSLLRFHPVPTTAVRIPALHIRAAPLPSVAAIRPRAADLSRPYAAKPEESGIPPSASAPAVADTRDSSARRWAASNPATHRQ